MNAISDTQILQENKIKSYDEVVDITKELSTKYCLLKYKQELELKRYKESFNLQIDDYIREIRENGISIKNIDNHRCAYEKLIKTSDYTNPNDKIKTEQEIAEFVYSMLIRTLDENKSNNMFAYKEQYIKSYDYIISYYKKYFEIKNAINNFKEEHNIELNKVKIEIQQEGIPVYIVKQMYKRLKTDLSVIRHSPDELQHCRDVYDSLKDVLIEQIKEIDKNF